MSNYLKLEFGQAYTVALRYPAPREVDGFNGRTQHRWQLMDGRGLYTPLEFKVQIDALKLKPGEQFTLAKVRENGQVIWKAARIAKAQPVAALLNGSGALDSPLPEEPLRIPPTRLEHALKTAVSAAYKAELEGQKIGYNVRFTPSDIRAMAISVLIGMERDAA